MANITSRTIKEKMGTNGYTPQKLGFDNRRPFNLGLDDQKAENSPFKATEGKYWYKINGKNVTKAEYNAYKNEPGKMEGGGKTTNDPDASGNKARIQAAREKLPKKATVLTEAQTKVKDQGTKIKKKPPFKAKDENFKKWADKQVKSGKWKKEKANNKVGYTWKDSKNRSLRQVYEGVKSQQGKHNSPLKNKYLNRLQTGLTVAGMVPGIGNLADMANTAVSAGRAGYAKYKGDEAGYKTHRNNAAINAAAMVPGAGLAVGGAKLAAKAAKGTKAVKVAKTLKNATDTTKMANRVASNTVKVGVKKAAKKGAVTGVKKKQEEIVRSKVNKKKIGDGKVYAENRPPKRTKAGAGVLKPKANKNKQPGFKTGLEAITSKKVA